MSATFLDRSKPRVKGLVRNHTELDEQPSTVKVTLTLDRDQFFRLAHLANATASRNTFLRPDCGVPALVLSLLNSLDEGICRPGSHERGCFSQLFGESLDIALGAMYAAGDGPKGGVV